MLKLYRQEAERRQDLDLPPLPLTAVQTREITQLLEQGGSENSFLLELLENRVEPGVSKSAQVKADWLKDVASGRVTVDGIDPEQAIAMLSQMGGGYNVEALIDLLEVESLAPFSVRALKRLTKIYDGFERIAGLAKTNSHAREVIVSWAKAEWFTESPELPESLDLTIYKVEGEINTDDFSPGNQAQSRADIPLHAQFFGASRFPDGIETITGFRADNKLVAFAGDVVGTGSSRKSAVNSLLWHTGKEIDYVPNKKTGSVVFAGTMAPIFYATARDAGILPVECEAEKLSTGDTVTLLLQKWTLQGPENNFIPIKTAPPTLLDEYRAGGRLNLIIGKQLTRRACTFLKVPFPAIFKEIGNPQPKQGQGYTLAQKMVGRACGVEGILPGSVCEPKMTTVGSQDTTGPMTMQEIAELACLRFKADLFMQSFCHTAAYPKASDFSRWQVMR
jgi:aconitate hydratase 2/2-methylisocitrate dehydratase